MASTVIRISVKEDSSKEDADELQAGFSSYVVHHVYHVYQVYQVKFKHVKKMVINQAICDEEERLRQLTRYNNGIL